MIIAKCRVNKYDGQKLITVPKEAAIYKGDDVILTKLEDQPQMNNDKGVEDNGRTDEQLRTKTEG